MDVILDRGSTPLTSRKKDPLRVGLFLEVRVYETVRSTSQVSRPSVSHSLSLQRLVNTSLFRSHVTARA